jgi:hypothetical protein
VRDIQEILKEKECALQQVRRELEALHSVSPFLSGLGTATPALQNKMSSERLDQLREAMHTVAPLLADETEQIDPALRARLAEAAENDRNCARSKGISNQLRRLASPLLGASLRRA